MAVAIRLTRQGRRHLPFYHIGVFNSRTRRDGTSVEELGFFDPESKKERVRLNVERAKYWLGVGAKPSDTVATLFKEQGLTSDLWIKARVKASKPKVRTAVKKEAAKKARSVQKGRKPRAAKKPVSTKSAAK